jgi:hypothetical protein
MGRLLIGQRLPSSLLRFICEYSLNASLSKTLLDITDRLF